MRGKAISKPAFTCIYGITPAYAGKSLHFVIADNTVVGSPPPMRGKVVMPA